MSENSSQQNKKKQSKQRNNRSRNRNKKQGPRANAKNQGPQGPQGKQNNPHKRRRRRSGPKLSPAQRIYRKYENLLEQHLHARRKYYELFNRADPKQKQKLEKNFYKTVADLRDFEASLKGRDREIFLERYELWGEVDRTYTENHQLDKEGKVEVSEEEISDPHLLESQIQSNYSNDNEETQGNYEDYLAYKEAQSS